MSMNLNFGHEIDHQGEFEIPLKKKIEIRVNNQFWEENKKPKATL